MWRFYVRLPILLLMSCGAATHHEPTASAVGGDDADRATIRQSAFRRCWEHNEAMARGVMGTPDRSAWQRECDQQAAVAVTDAERSNSVSERSAAISNEADLQALWDKCVADAHAAAVRARGTDYDSHQAECDQLVKQESERRGQRKKQDAIEVARNDPRCQVVVKHRPMQDNPVICVPRTQEDCVELKAKVKSIYVTGPGGGPEISCDPLPTREMVTTRRAERAKEACSNKNAREEIRYDSTSPEGDPDDDDAVQAVLTKCIEDRAAPCQALVDADDLIGAGACWSKWPWADQLKGDSSYDAQVMTSCLQRAKTLVDDATGCRAMTENGDDQLVAKADCFSKNDLSRTRGIRCGHLVLTGYVQRAADKLKPDAEAIDAKAKEPREKLKARNSVCTTFELIEIYDGQMKRQREIERESGVQDLDAKRKIGEAIVVAKGVQANALADFKRLWKRSFKRATDCAASH